MTQDSTTYLQNVLFRTGLFEPAEIEAILESARGSETPLAEIVAARGSVTEAGFLEQVSVVLGLAFCRLGDERIDKEALASLPTKVVFQYNVFPVKREGGRLVVATNDPFNVALRDTLQLAAGTRVKFTLSPSADIAKTAKAFYGVGAETLERMAADDRSEVDVDASLEKVDLNDLDQEASIVKYVNQVIWEACQQGATDIHVEPMEERLRIRYRVDGLLHETPVPPQLYRFQAAVISRIKVMANMDIAEKRLPLDGRIGLRIQGEDLDIRVSTMPTVYGESVSLRLLQRKGEFIGMPELGMSERDGAIVRKVIHRPNGIVLVTGPTGSGKSTSLYAYLHEVNRVDQRILTAEDPIEYEMAGINQLLVRPDIGLTFARALRSFLRQDPDIIMVGEIRDAETAEIAIQASLTGHLVFSTLHTNDSAGAFTRLLDMGVEPFLVASAVEAVVAQRLVRRLCRDCRRLVEPDETALRQAGFPVARLAGCTIYEEAGCEACRRSGFRGRGGIFEVLQVTEDIRSLVVQRSSSNVIRQRAIAQGMVNLRADGWEKVLLGFTTVGEVLRVTEEDDDAGI